VQRNNTEGAAHAGGLVSSAPRNAYGGPMSGGTQP
jgi:hypothetical protein